jgi:sterol desaturase/sphingolipid hydroxylase (fatty acid hydroxylase superfamily)
MENEAAIRLTIFLGAFAVLAIWERATPKRVLSVGWGRRWGTAWALAVLNTATVRLMALSATALALPVLAVGAALDAAAQGWGLFNIVDWPGWIEVLLAFLVLDFAIWAQHLLMHKVPVLWRLHRVHHADRDIDVTTAIRFHPIEIALSMLIKIGLVYLLGAAALAVILFEIALNGVAMFNHANIAIPARVERWLRLVVVTPDMHRVHHSAWRRETDSNYGFNLPWRDRLFATYTAQPRDGHQGMTIGLKEHQDQRPTGLLWSLAFPFRK